MKQHLIELTTENLAAINKFLDDGYYVSAQYNGNGAVFVLLTLYGAADQYALGITSVSVPGVY